MTREFEALLADLAASLHTTPVAARVLWLVGPASHVYDDDLSCATTAAGKPAHRMSFHRSMLFSALGAEALRPEVPLLDMWRMTGPASDRCAKVRRALELHMTLS